MRLSPRIPNSRTGPTLLMVIICAWLSHNGKLDVGDNIFVIHSQSCQSSVKWNISNLSTAHYLMQYVIDSTNFYLVWSEILASFVRKFQIPFPIQFLSCFLLLCFPTYVLDPSVVTGNDVWMISWFWSIVMWVVTSIQKTFICIVRDVLFCCTALIWIEQFGWVYRRVKYHPSV